MRIKSLQVHGFKSFVDKVVFSFDDGVTAVVGPNGCGKSNVVDAIRWVMGEQSAKRLRGKGMDDVIFAGSEDRPPIGMAEVVLTFDNADGTAPGIYSEYEEIQITRRLYRSGESEYLLNKTACRLRDVHDFFRDTGIGVKGYTIVEQGRIAEIVSAKADERRVLIEEAAGISKYKARRRQAESKIASTEQNLTRVNDVLSEIKRQISTLERQARKAARYKRLRETQRILELSIASDERRELLDSAAEAKGRLGLLEDQVTGLETNLSERELAVEEQRITLAESEKAVTASAERLVMLRSDIKQIEGQVELNRREVEGIDESNRGRTDEIGILRDQLESARNEAVEAEAELQQLDDALESEAENIAAAETDAREALEAMRALERERENANEAFVEILTGLARGEDRSSAVEDRGAEVDQRVRSADRELEVHQNAAIEAGREESQLEEGLRNLLGDRDRFQEQLRHAITANEQAGSSFEATSEARDQARERFEGRNARLASLEEVIERREDVGEATRHLIEGGSELRERLGIRGLVRELLEVERDAERAVEAVLSERAEAIVIKDAAGAVDAIERLREAEAGRGVFVVEPRSDAPSLGIVPLGQPLLQFVTPKPGCEGVARALLGDVYLIESLSRALEVYGEGAIPAIFVTSQGDVLSPDGVIRGGGDCAGTGMISRVREVRELREEVAHLGRELETRELAYREAQTLQQRCGEDLDNLRNRHHTAVLAVANHEKDLDRTRERVKSLGEAQEGRVAERSELLSEIDALGEEKHRLVEAVEELRVERGTKQRALDALGLRISSSGREVSRLDSRVAEFRMAHSTRVETRNRLEETATRGRGAVQETGEWIERREREVAAAGERRERLLRENLDAEQSLTGKLTAEEEERRTSEHVRGEFEARSSALRTTEEDVRGLRHELESRRSEVSAADLVVRESSMRLEHQDEVIRERWQVDLASWTPPRVEDFEPQGGATTPPVADAALQAPGRLEGREGDAAEEEAATESPAQTLRDLRENARLVELELPVRREHLEKLRSQVGALGDVNLGAIEEHEELAERFRFLSEQKEDLETTINSLREAISRINRTSRKRFRETFEAVSERFSQNFPRLFGGGRASLMLTEAEDVLEAGVDIMAQPPGKRNQIVNLLSGGEKTMTALALLMAVFQVRPSPFFLLDEVDAALDDANVGRFNTLITELAKESQFLVITHNKRTIEVADVLYGVTMQQKGVSKLVSVALD